MLRKKANLSNCGHTFPCIAMKTRVSGTIPNSGRSLVCPSASLSLGRALLSCFLSLSFRKEAQSKTNQRCWLVTKLLAKAETLSGTSSLEVSAFQNEWQTEVLPLASTSASPSPWCARSQEARQKG